MSEQNLYNIKISPEVIKNDIFKVTYSGGTATVYSSMTQILSGGTMGDSLLTDLSIPIFINQTVNDIGYYSGFDGLVLQSDTTNNFVYSRSSGNPYTYFVTNTSDIEKLKFLGFVNFDIDWGETNGVIQNANIFSPYIFSHLYSSPGTYTITITGQSSFGYMISQKIITVPFTGMTIDNPNGNIVFVPGTDSWSADVSNYDFIFSGDAVNEISAQTSNNYTTIPFTITGTTTSTLNDVSSYGPVPFILNVPVTGASGSIGIYLGITPVGYTAYTIDGVYFYDLPDGTTVYSIMSSGLTDDMITQVAITKEEALMGVVMQPEVQSDVYVERGKNTVLERIERIGEVDNMGDLEKYGYSFFNVKTYN